MILLNITNKTLLENMSLRDLEILQKDLTVRIATIKSLKLNEQEKDQISVANNICPQEIAEQTHETWTKGR